LRLKSVVKAGFAKELVGVRGILGLARIHQHSALWVSSKIVATTM